MLPRLSVQKLKQFVRSVVVREHMPWAFLGLAAAALLFQLNPAWRSALIYDRNEINAGEVWRLWSGHFIHFGWPHFITDTGLFLILGRLLEQKYPTAMRCTLALMPLVISGALYWCDPMMTRYAGLSAVNLGILLFYAVQGWQKNRLDWFWPGVLAIYIGEVVLESFQGHGQGGGLIQFDELRSAKP